MVEQLLEMGLVDLEKYFVDGTKIEANANRYSIIAFTKRKAKTNTSDFSCYPTQMKDTLLRTGSNP